MEESEKRKERLKAMRAEAAEAEACSSVETFPVPISLSNPLFENSAAQPIQEQPFAASRFGFYTDPTAAFSANKKRGQHDNYARQDYLMPPSFSAPPMARPSPFISEPRNSGMIPSPGHQLQTSSSFDQRMYQAQGPCNNPHSYRGPRGASMLPIHQGTPEAWSGLQATTSHYSCTTHSQRDPRGMASPFPMIHQGTPQSWNESGGTARYYSPSTASGGGQIFSPSFGYGQGRPQWQGRSSSPGSGRGGSPGPSSGRGRGRSYGGSVSPGLGYSGGRGQGLHSHGLGADGKQGPERFYNKSMDEDPWQQLEPLVWRSRNFKSPGSSNSWLPKSISMKKPRVSEASRQSSPQPSLAEYLAASFNEATNDAPNS